MLAPPQRQSLVAQVAATLRQAIRENAWDGALPGERRLSELLYVSRPTVRRALHLLQVEGLLEVQHGRRSHIVADAKSRLAAPRRLVGLITPEPLAHLSPVAFQGLAEMRQQLTQAGFDSEVHVNHGHSPKVQIRLIEAFLRENRVFCCVLVLVPHEVQQWFVQRGLPAFVLGSCHPDIRLPSLDVDFRAVCRHAAGFFLKHGHRRMALVVPDSGAAGDLASEAGFREGVQGRVAKDAGAIIIRHNGTARGITARLDAVFHGPQPPTALLVSRTLHVFIVILYLLQRGLAVPEKVSLVARDQDRSFALVQPPITHYAFESHTLARRLTRAMLRLASRGPLPPEPNLIFPRFIRGGTVQRRGPGD